MRHHRPKTHGSISMNGNSQTARDRIARARAIVSDDDARSVYAEWATTYDRDVFSTLKVTGTNTIADLLHKHTTDIQSARVLDAGCGTGAVAARLKLHGFDLIDGVDLSPDMLKLAKAKNLYRTLIEANLNQPFGLPHSALHRYRQRRHVHHGARRRRRLSLPVRPPSTTRPDGLRHRKPGLATRPVPYACRQAAGGRAGQPGRGNDAWRRTGRAHAGIAQDLKLTGNMDSVEPMNLIYCRSSFSL